MCTVTFIARRNGYCLGMNRDEKLTRLPGLPPTRKAARGRTVICPSEPSGGTWIALNDAGVCFALINWYSVIDRVEHRPISRGEVVRIVSGADVIRRANETLNTLPLERMNPFRLIGIFPADHEVLEWRWNLRELAAEHRPWETQQWISSGFNEVTAQKVRGKTFLRHLAKAPEHGLHWLRTLHQSHSPKAGPFSTCAHRTDAGTVSFTEVVIERRNAAMRYIAGYPCRRNSASELRLQLSQTPKVPSRTN